MRLPSFCIGRGVQRLTRVGEPSCEPASSNLQVGHSEPALPRLARKWEQVHRIAAAQRLTMGRTSLGQVAMALLKASSSDHSPVQNFCRGQAAATSQHLKQKVELVLARAFASVHTPVQNICRHSVATAETNQRGNKDQQESEAAMEQGGFPQLSNEKGSCKQARVLVMNLCPC